MLQTLNTHWPGSGRGPNGRPVPRESPWAAELTRPLPASLFHGVGLTKLHFYRIPPRFSFAIEPLHESGVFIWGAHPRFPPHILVQSQERGQ